MRAAPEVRHLSITIARSPAEVYAFASDPRNLPRWAAGLARSEVVPDGKDWAAKAPFGKVRIRFAEPNAFGVIDHEVFVESEPPVYNPMRVVPNGEASEFTFTLFRRTGMSDADFARDRTAVLADLKTLKSLLESGPKAQA